MLKFINNTTGKVIEAVSIKEKYKTIFGEIALLLELKDNYEYAIIESEYTYEGNN